MTKILKLNKISTKANEILPDYNLVDECSEPVGIILRSYKMHDYPLPESLLLVARAGAGTNNIPIDKCTDKGIVVFNTPGANANAVKELVLCSMFMCGRKIYDGINWIQGLEGQEGVAKKVEEGKKAFVGHEILGKTLGIIGLGAIGILTANAAVALGMDVIGYDPYLSEENAKTMDSRIKVVPTLDEIYSASDFISLHLPLMDSTRGMINKETLAKCKDGVNIINGARGELCDNTAIKEGIETGKVNRYVTDFPNEEVLGVKNIIPIPHLGASSPEAEDNCAIMASNQLKDYLENGNIKNSVNFPNVSLDRCSSKNCRRISVLYKGEIDINAKAKDLGIKINNSATASKKGNGYALLCVDDVSKADQLEKLDGVLRVRVI